MATNEQIINRIKRKVRLVKFLSIFFSKKRALRIACFISRNFGWIFGPLTKGDKGEQEERKEPS